MTRILFIQDDGREQEIDAADGRSVMQNALDKGVPGILGDCGGCLACATCHVYVPDDWVDRLDPPTDDEKAMLEVAIDPQPNSRLSCQLKVTEALDGLTVRVPANQI